MNRAAIEARIPHAGAMCLLHELLAHDATHVRCRVVNHRDAAHPLRLGSLLPAAAAVEYASQAMALHGSLSATTGAAPTAGFLAAVRALRLHVPQLDNVESDLIVEARRLQGDSGQAIYAFTLHDGSGHLLAEGRATVILNALP